MISDECSRAPDLPTESSGQEQNEAASQLTQDSAEISTIKVVQDALATEHDCTIYISAPQSKLMHLLPTHQAAQRKGCPSLDLWLQEEVKAKAVNECLQHMPH